MTQAIAGFVNNQGPNRTWTVLGDFNREPGTFFVPPQSWLYRTGLPTHQSGRELDYTVSSENIPNHPVRRRPGSSPDHYAVALGAMSAAAEPPELRILPFGDSITFGAGSTTAAYRGPLWDELRRQQENTTVSYVGSLHYGNIPDNDNEGHPNWKINDLIGITDSVMDTYKPNVVLLHMGTNDMNEAVDPAGAPDRLGNLMDRIFDRQPDVTLIVSTLVLSGNSATEQRISAFNNSLPQEVHERRSQGRRVWLVDNWAALNTGSDLADFLHPSDNGYRKMGHVFYDGIEAAEWAGWISPPPLLPGEGTGGPVRGWVPQEVVASGTMTPGSYPGNLSLGSSDRVHYADINGDSRLDFVVSHDSSPAEVWHNGGVNSDGSITWNYGRTFTTGIPLNGPYRWEFADVFVGDGRADSDWVTITQRWREGEDHDEVWVTRRPSMQVHGPFAGPRSSLNVNHRFADIDGDGSADWLQVHPDSSVRAALSTPGASTPWAQGLQVVASGVGKPGAAVRFADISGDGRADYLVVDPDGTVQAWINGGLNPGGGDYGWRPHGTIATGLRAPNSQIQFADLNKDGKADLLDVNPTTGETWLWRNGGQPAGVGWTWHQQGPITAGSSNRVVYADINADNRADYLQVNADSSIQAWVNGGPKPQGGDWIWIPQGTIAGGIGAPGRNVRLAGLNADGRADYLLVNDNSSVQAWINGGPNPDGGDWYWAPQGTIAGSVGAAGRNIRFTGLTGDRRADFLVVYDSSAVDLWTNGGPKPAGGDWYWAPQGTTASGVGVPGSQIQFADFNADRREDYLDVDPRTGSTRAWINFG